MPKEYVNSCFKLWDSPPPDGPPIPNFQVKVGWDKEAGHVQIATVDEDVNDLGSRNAGLYVDLDRQGINDLIRHLRRARDQAFGRDE